MSIKKEIMQILSKDISDEEKTREIDQHKEEYAASHYDKMSLITVSDAFKEMVAIRPSYYIKVERMSMINGRIYDTSDNSSESISMVSLAHKVKVRAEYQLRKVDYAASDGSANAAQYPREWLIKTLWDIFDL